jgi:hypothetical protein
VLELRPGVDLADWRAVEELLYAPRHDPLS